MYLKPYVKGLASYIPGLSLIPSLHNLASRGTGGTDSARYCYSVWLRHLVMAKRSGLDTNPAIIAELGPGDSLGMGLAALLTGAERFYAFDVVAYASNETNLVIFDELVKFFRKKERIPGETEFPMVKPYLPSYEFPSDILTDARLSAALAEDRVRRIRECLLGLGSAGQTKGLIQYLAPWDKAENVLPGSVDMIYSQAVLEHIDDLDHTYKALHRWLKPSGFMSHQIDFKSHGYARDWNGHWAYSDMSWKIIRGRRPYLLNRQAYSTHARLLAENGFKVVYDAKIKDAKGIPRQKLAPRFRTYTDEDMVTSGVFLQAKKA